MIDKILKKLRKRNLQTNFKQFLSVILIVLLSVTLFSGFIVNSYTLEKSVDRYFEKTNLADVWITTSNISEADEIFYDSTDLVYSKRLYIETTGSIESINSENTTKIYVSNGKVSTPYIESGVKGCLIDKNIAENLDINVGFDDIIFTINYALNSSQSVPITLKFRISGTMSMSECADSNSSWPLFIDEKDFIYCVNVAVSEYGLMISEIPYNQVLLKTDDVKKTKELVENYYKTSESELYYIFDRTSIEAVVMLESEVEQSRKMIYVFPIIFLFVAVLVILTTINQLVLQEKSKIGTLKSIGVQNKKLLNHYSSYGAYLCGIGSILGLILGPLIVPNVMFVKYDLLYSLPEEYVKMSFPWLWLLLLVVGIVLLGYLVSLMACHNILMKKPIECLKLEMNVKIKSKGKARMKKLPVSLKMAIRNVKVKPIRTIMATLGVIGCSALLLCGFGIGDTLNYSLKNDLGNLLKYDISTTYSSENFEENLSEVEGIVLSEKFVEYYAEAKTSNQVKNLTIYNISTNSQFVNLKLEKNDVVLTKAIAEELNIKVGDKLTLTLGDVSVEVVVTGFVETSFFNGIYTGVNLGFDDSYATFGMWLKTQGNSSKIAEEINKINGTKTAKTMDEYIEYVRNKISSIDLMTTTLKTFAIFLAVIVLLNFIFLILKERTREIATLKVVGQNILTIGLSVFFEILIMSVFGVVVGIMFGYPLLMLVLSINKVEIMNFLYHINALSFVWTALIVLLTICVVSIFIFVKAKRINMIESLKSVE